MIKTLLSIIYSLFLFGFLIYSPAEAKDKDKVPKKLKGLFDSGLHEPGKYDYMPYRLMKPIDYDSSKSYPLILSLHGAGGRGTNNIKNLKDWHIYLSEEKLRRKHPCFVLSPQMNSNWTFKHRRDPSKKGPLAVSLELIEELKKEYSIDADRIYLIGHSLGGQGTWLSIWNRPEYFAAAIPSAGAGFPEGWHIKLDPKYDNIDYSKFKNVPVWAFHSDDDQTIPVGKSRLIFDAMKKAQGNMKYTEVSKVGHAAYEYAYTYEGDTQSGYKTELASPQCDTSEKVWDWLFSKSLKNRK
ncbi:prolyl oligopeptidase family serine peptidase [Lentisphaera marina]|uniref:carboxylesterase family protein n=1 Tax=Lentisphaera marina TaxID=1111041 RepID=UPI002366CEDB|nr:prolyl oligopeptidase family serine peptidase [Lentisphaera marina]MDD7986585.1 prolyl oligopeptidase family serine peptidase [Lentisphaera marina]